MIFARLALSMVALRNKRQRARRRNHSTHHIAADEITFRPVPNHLRPAHAAKGAQRGHEIDRFENVRLALRVVAEQQVKAGRKIRVQPRVIAEVTESQMSQMHARKMERGRLVREFF